MAPTSDTTDRPTTDGANTDSGRRAFFRWITYGLGALATVLAGVPLLGCLFRVRSTGIDWVNLGSVGGFPEGETRYVAFDNPLAQPWDGVTGRTAVYVRNEGGAGGNSAQFLILAVNCAHLGCPVEWFAESGLFMCPCHGGVYYADGEHASGPPPRGMFQCVWRVRGGQLEIQAPHFPTLHDTLRQTAQQQQA
jgi:menaquinol-cytochrome c reductase iron-sulfur subunit